MSSCEVWLRFAPTREGNIDGMLGAHTPEVEQRARVYFTAKGVAAPVPADGAPGAPGPAGPAGKDGVDGADGAPGAAVHAAAPADRAGLSTCVTGKSRKRRKVALTCRSSRAMTVRVTRKGRTVAVVRGKKTARFNLARGRYVLHINGESMRVRL